MLLVLFMSLKLVLANKNQKSQLVAKQTEMEDELSDASISLS